MIASAALRPLTTNGTPSLLQVVNVHSVHKLFIREIVLLNRTGQTRFQRTLNGKTSHVIGAGPKFVFQKYARFFESAACERSQSVSVESRDLHASFCNGSGERPR